VPGRFGLAQSVTEKPTFEEVSEYSRPGEIPAQCYISACSALQPIAGTGSSAEVEILASLWADRDILNEPGPHSEDTFTFCSMSSISRGSRLKLVSVRVFP
jgi:hypothetical protein